MAILEMPIPLPVRAKTFDLAYNQEVTPLGGGFLQTIERSRPIWIGSWTTPPLDDTRLSAVMAFLDQLEGAMNTFIGFDPRRSVPVAYIGTAGFQASGFAPWGSASVTGSSYTESTLDVSFGASTQLAPGDYVSYVYEGSVYLHRCTEAQTGTSFTIGVKPRPLADITADLRMVRCGCEMKMLGKPKWDDSIDSRPTVQWSAVQHINRIPPG